MKSLQEYESETLKAIKENNLFYHSDIFPFVDFSEKTFYNNKLHELQTIKKALQDNRIKVKQGLKKKWYDSNAPATQIVLYKLLGNQEELERIDPKYIKDTPLQSTENIAYQYLNIFDNKLYTDVFRKNYEAFNKGWRIILNQGGTRSSKTYSIAQNLFLILLINEGLTISVVGKTLPHLRADAMRTFFNILESTGHYSKENHNKTENTYTMNGNVIEFFSVENEKKVRGRERDILWCPEANMLDRMDFQQLLMRTKKAVFADYNPSDEYHWLHEDIQTREDCFFIKSTYKDNSFLEKELIKEIEYLQETDTQLWNIYGLGERGTTDNAIYPIWDLYDKDPEGEIIYGLDFGYNNPSALCQVIIKEKDVYIKELLYETKLTNTDLIERLKNLEIGDVNYLFADCAEPARIQEIRQANINIHESIKDVKQGIDTVKRFRIHIHKNSSNLIKEIQHYKWKQDRDGKSLEEPVKFKDHLTDAFRYAIYTYSKKFSTNQFRAIGI